ncbi:hypothetical protein EW026_g4215 [Hermanssonia centrifuga]|uniref:Cytochrome P450 n=1 Tax=Hermanssonia centrifuga TaxID=98765 RepID=A0A4S4KIS8_9APHY|nr:hypothetical protein EW026_g4215 [Hermanssonia centrifuga]
MEQHVASTGLALALLVAAMGLYLMTRRKYMLPPGPKGLPIIGNTFNMPTNFEWLAYQKWSRDFNSDLIYLNLLGTPVVVLHSAKAAYELFEKRSAIYSDRMAGSIIMRITYGIEVLPTEDPYITTAEAALQSLAAAVDFIPALKYLPDWFPGAGFKKEAAAWRNPTRAMANVPFSEVQEALSNGTAVPSILSALLEKLDPNADNQRMEDRYRAAATTAYTGGSDTTVSSLGTFILAMMLYPTVQKRAREELDRVIGSDRLPSFEDELELPYVSAVVKEAFRWRTVLPLAVPHRLTVDDEYMGYDLPAGTLVVGNTWAILHDETRYPQSDEFDPCRYLTADGKLNPAAPDPITEAAFGYGRRICPGRHLAVASVWLTVASILATFDIEKPTDEHGQPIEPSGAYTSGTISYPLPFKCVFKVRSADAESLVRFAAQESVE